jgi:hypothetical protein
LKGKIRLCKACALRQKGTQHAAIFVCLRVEVRTDLCNNRTITPPACGRAEQQASNTCLGTSSFHIYTVSNYMSVKGTNQTANCVGGDVALTYYTSNGVSPSQNVIHFNGKRVPAISFACLRNVTALPKPIFTKLPNTEQQSVQVSGARFSPESENRIKIPLCL